MNKFAPVTQPCAVCDGGHATLSVVRQEFRYGSGDAAPLLHADVSVWHCDGCDEEYVDSDAEDQQHAAVCRFLGRATPDEIKSMRAEMGLNQQQFADRLMCGIASVKRWETGAVIQNAAVDAQMKELARAAEAIAQRPIFRSVISVEQLRQATMFCFHVPAVRHAVA
jgi:putative zinc finger/helix-turn-helix YgiT family protein